MNLERSVRSRAGRSIVYSMLLFVALVALYIHVGATDVHESDEASYVLQASAILHGNLTLSGWTLTSDTFWTIDTPLLVIAVAVFGVSPIVFLVVPSVVYAAIVSLTLWLVKGKRTIREAALPLLFAFALSAAPSSYLAYFFVKTAIHFGTILFVLIAIVFFDLALRHSMKRYLAVLGGLFLCLALIGDPLAIWFGAVPAIILFGLRCVRSEVRGPSDCTVFLSVLVAGLLSQVVLVAVPALGGFQRLSVYPAYVTIAAFPNNLALFIQGLLQLFHAFIFGLPVYSASSISSLIHLVVLVVICVLTYRTLRSLPSIIWHEQSTDWTSFMVQAYCATGMTLDAAVFLFSNQPTDPSAARYLEPVVCFAPILLGRSDFIPRLRPLRVRVFGVVGLSLFYLLLFTGVVFRPTAATANDAAALGRFLQSHGLTYGYGTYWDASIVTVSSREAVKVRPVVASGNRIIPYHWLSAASWYVDVGQARQARFVVFDNADGWRRVNRQTIVATFGNPARRYRVGPYHVYVYNRDITPDLFLR